MRSVFREQRFILNIRAVLQQTPQFCYVRFSARSVGADHCDTSLTNNPRKSTLPKVTHQGIGALSYWVNCPVEEGKAVNVVYLDFSKAFETISHGIVLKKLAAHSLDRSTLGWVRNWLDD
ncbi:hypothetical protein BTVI_09636 [Pitangus sulphuratus]|nr:hypothetical protein BTVI_09636 [Pitangus sulphuratus]